ncbi:prepilin-type N-terminal cleavage/methylation domain-containing protein [Sporolactobacillus spathodeae]|uniref:Prepilin-type N-terminal cleavage/methylation domain-containing protein n=1 Tax=Sporolactobacillus spathodeae TaxID=1465502 RepID=A0ABS2Q6J1_9BACL|nr:prepilin-type N-terminal cleavage/methylation domain-containing protein [Sporolactobacillus spathodeae]MBM7657404.1 prepilin-type N-terminal cleavage/methylation domain-containing protein [Sporolactobacillus spathodeae]
MDHGKNKGFTLVEVLAAITLLSLVIVAFSLSLVQAQQVVTNNGLRQTAMQIAQKEIAKAAKNQLDMSQLTEVATENKPEQSIDGYNCLFDSDASTSQNGGTYKVYLYLKSDEDSGSSSNDSSLVTEVSPMVVQVYYSPENYVEVYNTLNQ